MATESKSGLHLESVKESASARLADYVDLLRVDACRTLDRRHRQEMGQFFTPSEVARLMASMFKFDVPDLHLLDAGAGVGSLSVAFVEAACLADPRPKTVFVSAYEIHQGFLSHLQAAMEVCKEYCAHHRIDFQYEVLLDDFIEAGVSMVKGGMFAPPTKNFNYAILNPPYKKIRSDAHDRKLLSSIGIETTNLYAAFVSLSLQLLTDNGQLVAITPRSFCNGTYFRGFRKLLLSSLVLQRIHLFEARDKAFAEDSVLQENIILHGSKGKPHSFGNVTITSSENPRDELIATRVTPYSQVVRSNDGDSFIHLVPNELESHIAEQASSLASSLDDLDLSVSTGRVVEFRARNYLTQAPSVQTAPLIYPRNLLDGFVNWPIHGGRKPVGIQDRPETYDLLVPSGTYVLVKRFTSKEERRRIVAAILEPQRIGASRLGFENHLNYFHRNGRPMPETLAKGLCVFLNSTLVDVYFRHFSGHTQVNAQDLRNLRYPTLEQLEALGSTIDDRLPSQGQIDELVERELLLMPRKRKNMKALRANRKIREAIEILKALGLPRQQQNERSALTLLALLELKPMTPWKNAGRPMMGVTPMMDFFAANYGKRYAPNTRETVRRQTIHQFVQAGIVVPNPDDTGRSTNSPKAVYQIEPRLLELLRSYRSTAWNRKIKAYLTSADTLAKKYARERKMQRIPLQIAPGKRISLSAGGQSILVKQIIREFCPRFTPRGQPIYIGDTAKKWAYFDEGLLSSLGVRIDAHGKMPDVAVYYTARKWLVLVEAVTSHGPINPKRREELLELFSTSRAGLVLVTAFLDRKTLIKHLGDISWETDVWVAESPTHLIHFNGERFLGPY